MASEIATELAEQADRALTDAADVAVLRALEAGDWPATTWDAMAALGLNGALVPEEAGGVGLGFADVAPLLEVLGRHAA
jgi:alkylation response protein AidB-like acyl-CoA dehydrogenase